MVASVAIVEKHEARVGNMVENRDADLEGHHPVVSPVDQEDGRLDAGQVRRRTRVYAGMRTFISVMPWIRFE
jgi:hypothetical protein